jgi:hypothetical protein
MATGDSATDLNVEILDCMAELVASMLTRAEEVAQQYGVPIFFLKVFHRLDCPMAMKELGQRMRCDPSFRHQHRRPAGEAGTGDPGKRPGRQAGQADRPHPGRAGTETADRDRDP